VLQGECGVTKGSVPTFDVDLLTRSSVFVVKVTNLVISTYLRWKM
jgi:hypothetical protein